MRKTEAQLIAFNCLVQSNIADNQFLGVTIRGSNVGGKPNHAIAFDSFLSGTLFRLWKKGSDWPAGNFAGGIDLGTVLIIQENKDSTGGARADNADDGIFRPVGWNCNPSGQKHLVSCRRPCYRRPGFHRENNDRYKSAGLLFKTQPGTFTSYCASYLISISLWRSPWHCPYR